MNGHTGEMNGHTANGDPSEAVDAVTILQRKLAALLKEANDSELRNLLQRAWLLGPKRIGPNILSSSAPGMLRRNSRGSKTVALLVTSKATVLDPLAGIFEEQIMAFILLLPCLYFWTWFCS